MIRRDWLLYALIAALFCLIIVCLWLLAVVPLFAPKTASAQDGEIYRITGYNRYAFSPYTADGTSVYTGERIVAASYNLPFDTIIEIEGLGQYRVADRGHLGPRHIDVAVESNAEAYVITGYRMVWVVRRP